MHPLVKRVEIDKLTTKPTGTLIGLEFGLDGKVYAHFDDDTPRNTNIERKEMLIGQECGIDGDRDSVILSVKRLSKKKVQVEYLTFSTVSKRPLMYSDRPVERYNTDTHSSYKWVPAILFASGGSLSALYAKCSYIGRALTPSDKQESLIAEWVIPDYFRGYIVANDYRNFITGHIQSAPPNERGKKQRAPTASEELDGARIKIQVVRQNGPIHKVFEGLTTELNDAESYRINDSPLRFQETTSICAGDCVQVLYRPMVDEKRTLSWKHSVISLRVSCIDDPPIREQPFPAPVKLS